MNPLGKEPSGKIATCPESMFLCHISFQRSFERTKVKLQGLCLSLRVQRAMAPPQWLFSVCRPPQLPVQREEPALLRVYFLLQPHWTFQSHKKQMELASLFCR